MTEACLLVAVPASIVFPPPGASEENGPPHSSTRTQLPQSMKIMHEIMYKLEVLYVLCVLLMGRQRNQVRPARLQAAAPGRALPRRARERGEALPGRARRDASRARARERRGASRAHAARHSGRPAQLPPQGPGPGPAARGVAFLSPAV